MGNFDIFSCAFSSYAQEQPNLILMIADDCTYRDLEIYGGQAKTPNLKELAFEGMKFERCFQTAPMCSPTRHNIYTGLYPVKSGAYPNHTFVKKDVKSIVQYLKPAGYRVALSGKTHIAPVEAFPFEYSKAKKSKSESVINFEVIDNLMRESKDKNKPFCLMVCSNEPHSPWTKGDSSQYPPEKLKLPNYFVDTPETRDAYSRYLAEITFYDSELGRVLDLLKKYKIEENTLVMVVSEQGASFPFGKWTCYDTGLQAGMVVRWPGQVKPGSTTSAMVEYVDILPTFLEAAGLSCPDNLDGKSMTKVLQGKTNHHKSHVFGIHTTRGVIDGSDQFGIRSVRSEGFKLIMNLTPEVTFTNRCTTSPEFKSWVVKVKSGDTDAAEKVKRYQHRPAFELYQVTKDPTEWNNLAENPEFTHIKSKLLKKLKSWMDSQGDLGVATELAAYSRQKRHLRKGKDKRSKDK